VIKSQKISIKVRAAFAITSLVLIFCSSGYSQEIDSITMALDNGKVTVGYDFTQGTKDVPYEFYLYCSHDNFTKPLQYAIGDIGKNIYTGRQKTIIWDAQRELGNFKGDIILKIKGSEYKPFATFINVPERLKIKRGSIYSFEWSYEKKPEKVLVKVLKNGVPVQDPEITTNTGKYVWSVPKHVKAGKGYAFQLVDPENMLRQESSHEFTISRKIPLGYIIVPAAIVGVSAIFLLGPNEEGIPEPPSVPTNK